MLEINQLCDLNSLRSAPQLNKLQIEKLLEELEENILNSPLLSANSLDDFKKRMDDYEKDREIGS